MTNPANALTQILAAMIDRRGKVQIPGFYDDVVPLTDRERREFAALPFDEANYFADIGVSGAIGEEGYTTLERRWARPTFDICGIGGGYQGVGAKTVLPAAAGAKFSFRLVPHPGPGQDHRRAAGMAGRSSARRASTWELIDHHGAPGVMVPLDSPYIAAAARAIEHAFGRKPVYTREGGSIPIVLNFYRGVEGRHAVARLGPGRRQHAQSEREIFPGRFPSRHQGSRRSPCGRNWPAMKGPKRA